LPPQHTAPPLASLGPALLQQDNQQLKDYHEWQQAAADADRAFDAEVGDEVPGTPPTQRTPPLIPVCRAPAPGQPCAELYWNPQTGKFESPPESELSTPRFIQQPFKPQYQGITNNCGPFSTAIALNAYLDTDKYQGEKITQQMNESWRYRIPNNATWPWGISHYIRQQGVPARVGLFVSERQLHKTIEQNKVVIVLTGGLETTNINILGREFELKIKPWGHYKVLTGYDPKRGYQFADPQEGKIVFQPRQDFLDEWRHITIEVGK